MLLLTLYVFFTILVGIGVVRLYRILSWRHGAGGEPGGQAGGYGQMTVSTQQGFITLFDSGRRRGKTTGGSTMSKRPRKVPRRGSIKQPWGW